MMAANTCHGLLDPRCLECCVYLRSPADPIEKLTMLKIPQYNSQLPSTMYIPTLYPPFLLHLSLIILRITVPKPQQPLPNHKPNPRHQHLTQRPCHHLRPGQRWIAVKEIEKQHQLRNMRLPPHLPTVIQMAIQVPEEGLVPLPLHGVQPRAHDQRLRAQCRRGSRTCGAGPGES